MSSHDPAAHGRAASTASTASAASDGRASRSAVPPEDRLLSLLVALRTAPHPMSGLEISLHVHGYPGVWDDSAKRLLERDKQLVRQLGLPLETIGEGPGACYRLGDLAGSAAAAVGARSQAGSERWSAACDQTGAGEQTGAAAGHGETTSRAGKRPPSAGLAASQGTSLRAGAQSLDALVRPVRLSPAELGVLTLAAQAWSEGDLAATARSALAKLRGMSGPQIGPGLADGGPWQPGGEPTPDEGLADSGPAVDPGGLATSGQPVPSQEGKRAGQATPAQVPVSAGGEGSGEPAGIVLRLPAGEVPSALLEALATRRRVTFDYESASSGLRTRQVEPYRLRLGEPGWYLEGRDVELDQPRTFRLSRLQSAVRLVSPPAAFAPDAVPAVRTTAHLAIAPGHGLALRRRARAGAPPAPSQAAAAPDGWDHVALAYEPAEAAGLAGEIAAQCEWVSALAPAELTRLVREHLDGVLGVVERSGGRTHAGPGRGSGNTTADPEPAATSGQGRAAGDDGRAVRTNATQRRRPVRETRPRPTTRESVSRRLALLAWVERHPGASLTEAAQWFDVSEETIRQDVEAWWSAGREDAAELDMLDFDPAALEDGELYLTRGLQMSEPVGLTAQEVTCLRLALEVLRHGLGEDPRLAQLIAQADQALTSPARQQPGGADEAASVGGGTGVLATIRAAMDAGQSVHLVYVDALDQRTERDVDPLALIMGDASHTGGGSGTVPVLTAWCHLAGAQRTFRLDRVLQAVPTGRAARPPARAWRRPRAQAPSFRARLHVTQAGAWLAEEPYAQTARRLEDGTWEVEVAGWNRQWLVRLVLRAGRVLLGVSPRALAQDAAALARQAQEPQ